MEKIADKRNILEKLKPYQKKENDNLLKEYFDRWKNVTDKNKILRNMKSQKQLANTIGNVDESKKKNDLKKYFDKWKGDAVIKDKNELFEKHKKKVLQVLSNIYKTHRDSLIKKNFDKWRKASNIRRRKRKSYFKIKKTKIY